LSIADTRASIDAAVLADDSGVDVDDDSEECNFFGDMPNPDPEDLSPRDISGEFISLFVLSRKCHKTYSKSRKITTFYEALTVNNKSEILGDSPPRVVWDKFKLWRGAVKNRGKWTLDGIAESVFVISRHVHIISQRSSIFSSRLLASTAHPASAKGPSCSSSTRMS
jgi:hypothetical protein